MAPALELFGVLVAIAGEAAELVAAGAGCDEDEDVAAVFVGLAVDELDRELDGAAVGFVFCASPLTMKTPLPFKQQLSAVAPCPQQ